MPLDGAPGLPRPVDVAPTLHERLLPRDGDMRAAYGFGLPVFPTGYRTATVGGWSLSPRRAGVGSSYIAEHCLEAPFHVLKHEGETWMSTALLETESHAWHVHRATGNVVAAGLGMAMFALAAAHKPGVRRVVVGEVSPDVLALVRAAAPALPPTVEVVVMDVTGPGFAGAVRDALDGERPDYLFADIWSSYPHAEAPWLTRRLVEALDPVEAGWWGQEAALAEHCDETGEPLDVETATAFMACLGIPCAVTPGYVALCRDVGIAHGLRIDGSTPGPR